MSSNVKKSEKGMKERKVRFWDRLIYGKGTVAEPWPIVAEVLSDEEVQNEIKKVNKAFKSVDKKNRVNKS